jgi:putative addiction module antidote
MLVVKQQRLKKIGGSVAAVLPRAMLERLRLEAGDDVFVVETPEGILITPYDPDFRDAMAVYERGARKFRNALRELAR